MIELQDEYLRHFRRERLIKLQLHRASTPKAASHFIALLVKLSFLNLPSFWYVGSPRAG